MARIRNHADFIKKLEKVVGNEYEVLAPYVNSTQKIKVRHTVCGFEYEVLSGNILKGRKCPKCQKRVKTKDTDYWKNEVFEFTGIEYEVLGEYVNSRTKIEMLHNVCGHKFKTTPNDFQQGKRCPLCAGNIVKTHEEFLTEVKSLVGDEYEVLSDYESVNKHVLMRHNICGHTYKVTPSNFVYRERRCSKCKYSKGEKAIEKFLLKHNLDFKPQFFFEDLTSEKDVYLRFDFAVIENNNVKCLIEYDGEFHFKAKSHFGGEKALKKQQLHDKKKNNFCEKHQIPLTRIPYWDYKNIETILKSTVL